MKKLVVGGVVVALAVTAWWLWHRGHGAKVTATNQSAGHVVPSEGRAKAAMPASLVGRVTNKVGGEGIAGAVVAITEGGLGGAITPDHPPIIVVADATGAFAAPKVPPGGYVVTAAAVGFLPARTEKLWIASAEQKTGVLLALAAGGTLLSGTVSDIGGGPIQDAKIRVRRDDGIAFGSDYVAITNHDGHYEMSLPDGNFTATAEHDDYTRKNEVVEIDGKSVTQDFVLTPGAAVRGVVIARDTGKPIPNAVVHASSSHSRFEYGGTPHATTDADGTFTVKSLNAGIISVTALARGYASMSPTTVAVGIGEQVDSVRVVLDRAYSISGTTVKKGSKEPVPGVHLGVFSMQGGQVVAKDPSDDKGRFEIFGVKPGSFMVFAFGESSVPNMGKPIQVIDKDVTGVEIALETGVTISGRVQPPQDAALSLELAGEIGMANAFDSAKTMMVHDDADPQTGAFSLHNVPAGSFKLVARSPAGPVGSQPIVVAELDQHDVVIQLEARASIAGRVLDTTGAPVGGVEVSAMRTDAGDGDHRIAFGDGGHSEATTSANGAFKLLSLQAGTYELSAHVRDEMFDFGGHTDKAGKDNKAHPEVVVGAAEAKTGAVITIPARNSTIRGVVIGSDKQPAADTWVTARHWPSRAATAKDGEALSYEGEWMATSEPVLTSTDGTFTIAKLREGDYKVIAEGPRGSSRAEKKAKTGDTITIELAPLGTLSGKVTSNGAPVVGYELHCNGPGGGNDRSSAAVDGGYSLEHLVPGAYNCTVEADAGTANGKVDVPAGAATLDLALTPWASITGQIVSMFDKSGIPHLGVVASGAGGGGMLEAISGGGPKTDAGGRFTLPKVGTGKGWLTVMPKDGFDPLATKEYEIVNGQHLDLGQISIVPPRQGDPGTFGMTTVWTDVLTVTQVKPGGPAANAGIVVGDVITTLAGQPVKTLGGPQVEQYLASGSIGIGTTVQLGLARGATVSLTSVKR